MGHGTYGISPEKYGALVGHLQKMGFDIGTHPKITLNGYEFRMENGGPTATVWPQGYIHVKADGFSGIGFGHMGKHKQIEGELKALTFYVADGSPKAALIQNGGKSPDFLGIVRSFDVIGQKPGQTQESGQEIIGLEERVGDGAEQIALASI